VAYVTPPPSPQTTQQLSTCASSPCYSPPSSRFTISSSSSAVSSPSPLPLPRRLPPCRPRPLGAAAACMGRTRWGSASGHAKARVGWLQQEATCVRVLPPPCPASPYHPLALCNANPPGLRALKAEAAPPTHSQSKSSSEPNPSSSSPLPKGSARLLRVTMRSGSNSACSSTNKGDGELRRWHPPSQSWPHSPPMSVVMEHGSPTQPQKLGHGGGIQCPTQYPHPHPHPR